MFLICVLIGIGMLSLVRNRRFFVTLYLVAGIIGITVYTEFFSIFAGIGMWAHVALVAAALVSGYRNRRTAGQLWQTYRPVLFSWEGFFYCCFVLLIAFLPLGESFTPIRISIMRRQSESMRSTVLSKASAIYSFTMPTTVPTSHLHPYSV